MTIKALLKYLKDHHKHLFHKTNMYTFHKSKISIDVSGIAYSYWAVKQRHMTYKISNAAEEINLDELCDVWLKHIWTFISKLLRLGITPVMVFDGEPPAEKAEVMKMRSSKKKSGKEEISDFLEKMRKIDPLLRTSSDVEHLRSLYNKVTLLTGNHMAILKAFLNGLGLPVLQAKNEAEELCCLLCREGLVSAVYCEDSDCMAHLAPCWLFNKADTTEYVSERHERIEQFEYLLISEVLQELKLSESSFVDLCIMCGCDYNINIKNIGPDKSYKRLLKCGSIDNITDIDTSILNHNSCRKLFKKRKYEESCLTPDYELKVDVKCIDTYAKEYLEKCNMDAVFIDITFIYAAFPTETVKISLENKSPDLTITDINLHINNIIIPNINLLNFKY